MSLTPEQNTNSTEPVQGKGGRLRNRIRISPEHRFISARGIGCIPDNPQLTIHPIRTCCWLKRAQLIGNQA